MHDDDLLDITAFTPFQSTLIPLIILRNPGPQVVRLAEAPAVVGGLPLCIQLTTDFPNDQNVTAPSPTSLTHQVRPTASSLTLLTRRVSPAPVSTG
jgi:hypothetical protein